MNNPAELRIIFMGTSAYAAAILESLVDNGYNIISVYTQPNKKDGNEKKNQKSPVRLMSEKKQLKIFAPEKFNEEVVGQLKSQEPDMIIVAAYGKILPKSILDFPEFGSLNIHASLLPEWRGPSPVQNSILKGARKTGVSIMLMNEGIDTGNILAQEKIGIDPDILYPDFLEKIALLSKELLLKTIPFWIEKKITPQKQDDSRATRCQLIKRQNGKIIWTEEAVSIYNRYRAFYPWPGIFTFWEKGGHKSRIKLQKVSLAQNYARHLGEKPGEVFSLDGKIAVQAGNGAIILDEVQLEGKIKTGISDFIHGYPQFMGSVLK
jgi:methionyl-tRNA formyltransferase